MLRVLVVDDNEIFRRALSTLVGMQPDMEVVAQAGSLAEARRWLGPTNVAVVDRGLPDGDGIELVSEMRQANPGVAVLVMSATVEQGPLEQALGAGADGVLEKTAAPSEIADRIRAAANG